MGKTTNQTMPFKISVLVFLRNEKGEELLLKRKKAPNKDCWSPIGGKLEMSLGESPLECACREIAEETGLTVEENDLHLYGMISEKSYEGTGHWLMFLYRYKKTIHALPPAMDEGHFSFFPLAAIPELPIPETDRQLLWPIYEKYQDRFVAMRANCHPDQPLDFQIEEVI
ncbi:MAG: NUDIX domain-containing protein [Opitutales bacterium]|nr:NUDIX domain-containing protein [Opitutales bacterium]